MTFCDPIYTSLFVTFFVRIYMCVCKKMVIYLGIKTPQSRKERKYTWHYCLIVSLNCRCWRFVWKDLNIFFGYIERTVQTHSDMVNKCTWVVVEPLWKWLVILLQFPSGPVLLHSTVSIPERLVSHLLARKSYLNDLFCLSISLLVLIASSN